MRGVLRRGPQGPVRRGIARGAEEEVRVHTLMIREGGLLSTNACMCPSCSSMMS